MADPPAIMLTENPTDIGGLKANIAVTMWMSPWLFPVMVSVYGPGD